VKCIVWLLFTIGTCVCVVRQERCWLMVDYWMKSCGVETTSVTSEYPGCSDPAGGMLLLCAGCDGPILDRFLLNVLDRVWHAKCVQCSECRCALADKCFARDGRLFCRQDFFRYVKRHHAHALSCQRFCPVKGKRVLTLLKRKKWIWQYVKCIVWLLSTIGTCV